MKKILLLFTFLISLYNVNYAQCTNSISAGIIGADQTICFGYFPTAITQIVAPTNIIGTPTYKWEASVMASGPFTLMTGATNATYSFSIPLTQDVYLRRVITDAGIAPCNVAYSNVVHITVLPELMSGVIGTDETICAGTIPYTITEISAATGGTGTYTYQWQSDESGSFSNIFGAANATYIPTALTYTTQFRRLETSGMCGTVTSNIVTKTITIPEVVTVSINDPGQVCSESAPITFTATASTTGTGTLCYAWSLNGTLVGTNSAFFTYSPVLVGDNGKVLKVVVETTNSCNTGSKSASITLDIVNSVTPIVIISTPFNPLCEGFPISFNAIPANGGATPTYQWYVKPSGSAVASTVGTEYSSYSSASLHNGDQVYVELISSLICSANNPVASNIVTLNIKSVPRPSIVEGDQTVCVGSTATFTATTFMGNTVQWYYNGLPITGAKILTYTASHMGSYSIQEDNGACNAISPSVTLTIDPCGAFSTAITGPNPITPGEQDAVYSVFNQTGFSYDWSVTGGTIASGQNTNVVTVDWDNATSPVARTASTGYSISVTETNQANKTNTTTLDINTVATGISKSLSQAGITLFPNPATDAFSIEMPESGLSVSYEILDIAGLSVANGTFTSSTIGQQIPSDFGPGLYQVVLHYNNVVTVGRLSKVQ